MDLELGWVPAYGLRQPGKCSGYRCWHVDKRCLPVWGCKHHWFYYPGDGWHCPSCPERLGDPYTEKVRYVSLSVRYQIMIRDGHKCQLCGRNVSDGIKLEIDHKVPVSRGGENALDNLWTLCFDCNRGKSDN